MSHLYLFIDESGNHTQQDCYVVSGCWCLSESTELGRVLRPTKNRISDNIIYSNDGPSPGHEIKGSDMSESKIDSAFAYLRKAVYQDKTIIESGFPWNEYPIAYSIYDSDSDLVKGISEQYLGQGRSQTPAQLIGLSSVISPIFRIENQVTQSIESYNVVLDAETWERPKAQLNSIIGSIEWAPSVQFTIKNSKQVPGIQLADMAAYTRRCQLYHSSCNNAMRFLNSLLL